MKPIKRGFKVCILADSKNGYAYNFRIYTGNGINRTTGIGEHVVKDMVQDIKFTYRQLYFDNYFTTPDLVSYLSKNGLYAAGTVCINRKNTPQDFCNLSKKMDRSEFEYITSEDLVLHKWMNKKLWFSCYRISINQCLMILFNEKIRKVKSLTSNIPDLSLITTSNWEVWTELIKEEKAMR